MSKDNPGGRWLVTVTFVTGIAILALVVGGVVYQKLQIEKRNEEFEEIRRTWGMKSDPQSQLEFQRRLNEIDHGTDPRLFYRQMIPVYWVMAIAGMILVVVGMRNYAVILMSRDQTQTRR